MEGNHEGSSLLAGWFYSEGKIHLSKVAPEVWNYENLFERRLSLWLMEP